jgi:hypothetical protein
MNSVSNAIRSASQPRALCMVSLKLTIAALSFVSLAAISSPRGAENSDVKRTEPAPMPREVQAVARARCALLTGPEYHECLYAVIMRQPGRQVTPETRRPS